MGRPATGEIVERADATGAVRRSLRFRAYSKRHTQPLGVVSHAEAEKVLRRVMVEVEQKVWQPPRALEPPPEPVEVPTFHELAEEWWLRNEGQLAESTRADYRWRLERHLLPAFGELCVERIDFDAVEHYIAGKLAEGERIRAAAAKGEPLTEGFTDAHGRKRQRPLRPLSPRSINMTVTLLGAVLEGAEERGLIDRNPARGKRRRARERRPRRSYLDSAAQVAALLAAAADLDREAPQHRQHVERRAMLATLTFAGLRIGELCALRWRDVDLAAGWLTTGSKTDAGYRKVKIRGALRDVLLDLRARRAGGQNAYVFATSTGGRLSADNFRSRVLRAAVTRANGNLLSDDLPPLPDGLTPHSLRRTFCSILYALGEDPGVVMDEMGHTDPALALRVYRQAMRRGEDEKAALRALAEGGIWANMGERPDSVSLPAVDRAAA